MPIHSAEIKKIKQICNKISNGLDPQTEIIVLEEERTVSDEKHCDAVIIAPSRKLIVILEVTGRVTLGEDVKKLQKTYETLPRILSNRSDLQYRNVIFVIHRERISSLDAKLMKNLKVHGFPIFSMRCTDTLVRILGL